MFLQEMHSSSFCGSWKPQKGHGVVSSSSSDVSGRLWTRSHRRCEEKGENESEEAEEATGRERREDSPNHSLDFLPVRGVDVAAVLWSHQHGSKAEG